MVLQQHALLRAKHLGPGKPHPPEDAILPEELVPQRSENMQNDKSRKRISQPTVPFHQQMCQVLIDGKNGVDMPGKEIDTAIECTGDQCNGWHKTHQDIDQHMSYLRRLDLMRRAGNMFRNQAARPPVHTHDKQHQHQQP